MNKGTFQKLLPHLIALIVFLLVAVIYCKPALEGKVLQQHDVTQWKAMAQDAFEYKERTGHFPLWTKSMFSGMPAYQIAMEAGNALSPGFFYYVLTLGLPKPISFFFLASICFYFLSIVLRVNPYISIIGGLAYAYATYNPIIIAAGHDTKMQSIALLPAFIGSILLVYGGRYWLGGALTALTATLLVGMNHPQIVYYGLMIAVFMTVAYIISWVRKGNSRHLALSLAIVAFAGLLGVLTNAVSLLTTYEYAKSSIRGGSELGDGTSGATRTGLSNDYALSYSMYKTEPFVMMVPNMYGGSGTAIEELVDDSKALEALQAMPQELSSQIAGARSSYWGGIGPTSGPPYVGAVICFLALMGFFILDNRHKWWILSLLVLSLLMSWGSYFEGFNSVLLNVLPMYNKFRAPSMIIVIPTFLLCMMAVMSLHAMLFAENNEAFKDRFKKGLLLNAGVLLVLLIIYFTSDYKSSGDEQLLSQVGAAPEQVQGYVRGFLNGLEEDRKSLFFSSLLRTLFLMLASAGVLWLAIRGKMGKWVAVGVLGVMALADVMSVNTKYLNSENYQEQEEYDVSFTPTPVDTQIMQDTSYYRVLDVRQGLSVALGMQGALPSYFHNSIGGYHPAKLSIYQDLIQHQLSKFPNSLPVINMLNTKYVIQADQSGAASVFTNPDAAGPAWFVKALRFEKGPAEVMNALSTFSPRDTAILFEKDKAIVPAASAQDSASQIRLISNSNDELIYSSSSASAGFAVFSEIYYEKGWKAFIDGKETPIVRTNYVLRGLTVPAGQHEIRFAFKPDSYFTGKTISLVAGLLVLLFLAVAVYMTYKNRNTFSSEENSRIAKRNV
ncbi:MAG TPA: YfhO family protein [Flavisolibacter sp.]|nr:YfhO family protein [Flavisolibacter sp.]